MKTYVIRSDLTHAAHAGGTTIRDRICRHRLRVVLVGNGNLEGLSINALTMERYSRARTSANDRF